MKLGEQFEEERDEDDVVTRVSGITFCVTGSQSQSCLFFLINHLLQSFEKTLNPFFVAHCGFDAIRLEWHLMSFCCHSHSSINREKYVFMYFHHIMFHIEELMLIS